MTSMLTGEKRDGLKCEFVGIYQAKFEIHPSDLGDIADYWLDIIEKQLEGKVMQIREEIENVEISYGEDSLREFKASERVKDCILDLDSLQINKKQP